MQNNTENARNQFYKGRTHGTGLFELTFQMTADCNFRCSYCYEVKNPKKLKLENAFYVIDKMFPFEDNLDYWNKDFLLTTKKNIIEFNFFGGECFLEVDNMEKICQHFWDKCDEDPERYSEYKRNFSMVCQTNGYLLQTPKVKAFLDKWSKRCNVSIFITIDGCKEFHDKCRVLKSNGGPTWQVVYDNIKWYEKTYNKIPQTKGTISPETLPYLYKSYLTYKELGYRVVRTTIRNDCKWTKDDEKIYKEQLKLIIDDMLAYPDGRIMWSTFIDPYFVKTRERKLFNVGTCHSNGAGVCVSVDDKIYLCYNFSPVSIPEFLGRGDTSIGTVKDGISERGIEFVERIRRMVDRYEMENEKCWSCLAEPSCEFCPAVNLKTTGDVDIDEKNACGMKKVEQAMGMYYFYLRNKLYPDIDTPDYKAKDVRRRFEKEYFDTLNEIKAGGTNYEETN